MSFETDRWSELTREQANFFAGQVAAANQIAFDPAAQEAGVTVHEGSRFAFRGGRKDFVALAWTDLAESQSVCFTIQNDRNTREAAFVRVHETPDTFGVEGVALGLRRKGIDRTINNVYGNLLVQRHEFEPGVNALNVGAEFIITALQRASEMSNEPHILSTGIQLKGIPGATSASLLRSLNTLGINMLVGGALTERGPVKGRTYDLAQAFLHMAMNEAAHPQRSDSGNLEVDKRGTPIGASYRTEDNGSVTIRNTGTFPNAIVLSTTMPPENGTVYVEQHTIKAHKTHLDLLAIPHEGYDQQPEAMTAPQRTLPASVNHLVSTELDEAGTRSLESKIIDLMGKKARLVA